MKINLAILGTLLAIGGLVWQGSAKLTRMELALESVPDLKAQVQKLRETVIILVAHDRESTIVQRSHVQSWLDETVAVNKRQYAGTVLAERK